VVWLNQVKEALGGEIPLQATWRPFSLAQVNQKIGPDYEAWNEDDENLDESLWGLRAGQAARRQGEEYLNEFLPRLLTARHVDRVSLSDKSILKNIAQECGLDINKFSEDLEDRSTLEEIKASHIEATQSLGVFGTPTFILKEGGSAFVKMIKPNTNEEALAAFNSLITLLKSAPFLGEVKRPQPPWPKGVFD
jgi:protein-disulfide isomerase-like protein with CxxC motif|tara:strand:+ start:827 stop:1405 length:579 start_codon:yes stop_codon:yes gene_type:complete